MRRSVRQRRVRRWSSICTPATRRLDVRPKPGGVARASCPRIKQSTKAVVENLTTGGAPYMTVQERVKPAETFKPEVASLNVGSMNFGLFPMLNRFKSFKHDWEAASA